MTTSFLDTWAEAKKAGTAVAYSGNEAGNTRNSRIDYVWLSRGTTSVVIKGAQVFDFRDANGKMPSDHRPVMGIYEVR
jgi:exonuclease III